MGKLLAATLLMATLLFGADDPWAKVRELKSGTELRIIRKGARQPILATMDELTDDQLLIATKKEQLAIPKDQIERIDYRPKSDGKMTKETRTSETGPDPTPGLGLGRQNGSQSSTSTSFSSGGKPDFQTVYRATAASVMPR